MSKKLFFGSNLKMYKNIKDTVSYLQDLESLTKDISRDEIELFIIPSYTTLDSASKAIDQKNIRLGAQNMCWEEQGQFTGEISPLMLQEAGIGLVMIGHSERRHVFGETDIEENLLVQIFYMVTGDPEYFRRTSRTRGTQCGCICTDFEKTEIRFYFEFYKDALNQELEAFLMAFKLKNHLFPDESARCFVPEEEEEISEMLLKAQKFAEDIDKFNPVRRIASADLSADPDALES